MALSRQQILRLVDALEAAGAPPFPSEHPAHTLTLAEWASFLLEHLPRQYTEPPSPRTISVAVLAANKVEVMRDRDTAGLHIFHPDDLDLRDRERRDMQAAVERIAIASSRDRNGVARQGPLTCRTGPDDEPSHDEELRALDSWRPWWARSPVLTMPADRPERRPAA